MKLLDDLRAYLDRPARPAPEADGALAGTSGKGFRSHERRALRVVRREREIYRYASAIRAVRRSGDGVEITPIGRLVLELPDRDAVRWTLAAEVVQSLGSEDEQRLSADAAAALLKNPEGSAAWGEDPESWPVREGTIRRLADLGIMKMVDQVDHHMTIYEVSLGGRRLLEEIVSGVDTPFMLLARALLQDETSIALSSYPFVGASVRKESSASIVTRHARMVAHEIRNVVVPMRIELDALYQDVGARGAPALEGRHRDFLDAGIQRIFRFAFDVAQIADLATATAELFTVAPAVQDAIQATQPELPGAVTFVQEADLAPVMGYRQRFIMAVGNLLRNAAQARQDPPVDIRVTAGVNNGAEVLVRVDDNGPGVPPELREEIFRPGFSRRSGGTGQGLAHVREVVEDEMAGKIICEESPLGGARFVLRLPVGTRRSA